MAEEVIDGFKLQNLMVTGQTTQVWEVVELASQGMSNPDIARELFLSRNTVKVYLSRAYAKLGVANRTELARLAARHLQGR